MGDEQPEKTPAGFLIADPLAIPLEPSSIRPEWILSGAPLAWNKELIKSSDRNSSVFVWECTPGTFHWHYAQDESVLVLAGEAFMTISATEERRFAAGDVGFFPAGFSCQWRVTQRFRKVAVVRVALWRPLGLAVKAWEKLFSLSGLRGEPRF